jgi:L-ascorbate metabolism protein UlaG (beta-lactamase superfamily)
MKKLLNKPFTKWLVGCLGVLLIGWIIYLTPLGRELTVILLGKMGSVAVPLLQHALQDEDYGVRSAAENALKALGATAVPSFGRALSDVSPPPSRISAAGDPSDLKLALKPDQVAIEYIAHACFRIHSATGTRILIDPYASRVWLGKIIPQQLAADAVLITHPHYDHDAGQFIGRKAPWTPEVRVLREPGADTVGDIRVTGIRGKHADPWGKEFGQRNTIWLLEVASLRIAHLGDNGPLTKANVQELGRVDILMMPIDAQYHILKELEIREIRSALRPRVLIPMHYRIPDLEASQNSPADLGPIDPWLAKEKNASRLKNNQTIFTGASLPLAEQIILFHHSPRVRAAQRLLPRRSVLHQPSGKPA